MSAKKPFGQVRKPPSVDEFSRYFERQGDVAVLKGFLDSTATWVRENFHLLELEIHQAGTHGCAAKQPDFDSLKKQFPRLAVVASDADWQGITKPGLSPKKVAADILARILHRNHSSILRWAQGKK